MTSPPAHRGIRADNLGIRYAAGVSRHRLEDGAVRQSPRLSRPVETTDITLRLGDTADRDAFMAWAEEHAHDWFALGLPHRQGSDVRVVGGAPGITYRQRNTAPGAPLWEASMSVEAQPLDVALIAGNLLWPDYARIEAGVDVAVDGVVRRTTVADGPPVRQGARTGASLLRLHRLRALLDAERLLPFLTWCYNAARRRFWFPTATADTWQRRRLYDGLGSLALRQTARGAGLAVWQAELVTEGWDWDTRIIREDGNG